MLHLHRNQSVDLHSKSIDWFLYECNICLIWVKFMTTEATVQRCFAEYVILKMLHIHRKTPTSESTLSIKKLPYHLLFCWELTKFFHINYLTEYLRTTVSTIVCRHCLSPHLYRVIFIIERALPFDDSIWQRWLHIVWF